MTFLIAVILVALLAYLVIGAVLTYMLVRLWGVPEGDAILAGQVWPIFFVVQIFNFPAWASNLAVRHAKRHRQ